MVRGSCRIWRSTRPAVARVSRAFMPAPASGGRSRLGAVDEGEEGLLDVGGAGGGEHAVRGCRRRAAALAHEQQAVAAARPRP